MAASKANRTTSCCICMLLLRWSAYGGSSTTEMSFLFWCGSHDGERTADSKDKRPFSIHCYSFDADQWPGDLDSRVARAPAQVIRSRRQWSRWRSSLVTSDWSIQPIALHFIAHFVWLWLWVSPNFTNSSVFSVSSSLSVSVSVSTVLVTCFRLFRRWNHCGSPDDIAEANFCETKGGRNWAARQTEQRINI